jgi:hypothetical protein
MCGGKCLGDPRLPKIPPFSAPYPHVMPPPYEESVFITFKLNQQEQQEAENMNIIIGTLNSMGWVGS